MKKNILFFIIFLSYAPTYTMLTRIVRSSQRKPISRPMTTKCKHPYIADVYSAMLNKDISHSEKQEIINDRLDKDLEREEKKALQLLRQIILPDQQSTTLLHSIVEQNDKDLLSIAFAYGFIKHINTQDQRKNTPLYIAAVNGYTPMVETLLAKKANVNAQNEKKRTSLMGALLALDDHYSLLPPQIFINIIHLLKYSGADAFISDDTNETTFDHITKTVQALELHRARTKYNEDGEWIVMYTDLYNFLKE